MTITDPKPRQIDPNRKPKPVIQITPPPVIQISLKWRPKLYRVTQMLKQTQICRKMGRCHMQIALKHSPTTPHNPHKPKRALHTLFTPIRTPQKSKIEIKYNVSYK